MLRSTRRVLTFGIVTLAMILVSLGTGHATLHNVDQVSLTFSPSNLTILAGDTVRWTWTGGSHTVTSGTGAADPNVGALFDAPLNSVSTTFDYVFNTPGTYPYFCRPHESFGMTGVITVDAPSSVAAPSIVASLGQNFPNPFEGTTSISFTLNETARVTLSVHDVRGRLVATLDHGQRGSGLHTVGWNGKDAGGVKVSAGVYYYRLEAGNAVLTRKLVLIR